MCAIVTCYKRSNFHINSFETVVNEIDPVSVHQVTETNQSIQNKLLLSSVTYQLLFWSDVFFFSRFLNQYCRRIVVINHFIPKKRNKTRLFPILKCYDPIIRIFKRLHPTRPVPNPLEITNESIEFRQKHKIQEK